MSNHYYERFAEALPDPGILTGKKKELEAAGVKYIFSCWVDIFGIPKTKPVPMSDFELLFMGKGPQFAVHSVSFIPELGPADSDQIPLPDIDTIQICPWDKSDCVGILGPVVGGQAVQPLPQAGTETRHPGRRDPWLYHVRRY